jgi:hypothetical protein
MRRAMAEGLNTGATMFARTAFALSLCLTASPLLAEPDMTKECAVQAGLAQTIADFRLAGTSSRKAERTVLKSLTEESQKYADFVPMLVAFLYDQTPIEAVNDQVGASWEAQCLAAAK